MCTAAVARANTQIATWSAPNRVVLWGKVIVVTSLGSSGSCRRCRPPGVSNVIGTWPHSRAASAAFTGDSFTAGEGVLDVSGGGASPSQLTLSAAGLEASAGGRGDDRTRTAISL